ncbi:MAG: MFS transporter [Alphaproteobacteria bacterium]|nr:MFS transporter [Alphaproteobacteria bacterium]
MSTPEPARTVQQYIDETPSWHDGTPTPGAPLTAMQWRIWLLAAAGKFFEGLVVFLTGVALPIMAKEFSLDGAGHGLVGAAPLAGILFGATLLGGMADRFGRKPVFVGEMFLFIAFLVAISLAPNLPVLVICLFGMGLALGADYPTAHMVISESIPSKTRGRLVIGAFGFQALGALSGVAVGYLILINEPNLSAWRWMYATAVLPAAIVAFGRFFVPESANWLMAKGDRPAARTALSVLLRREPRYPADFELAPAPVDAAWSSGYGALFDRRHRRATAFASLPWFLQDLGTYGIGIFTPTILAATLGHSVVKSGTVSQVVHGDIAAAKGTAMIDILLIVGIVAAVLLADRVGRVKLQIYGFIGCAAGLLLAALSSVFDGTTQLILIFAGFMLFNFMTNMGPNAQTYLIAGEVFPTHLRGKGAGFAASFAKLGAVATAFLFPVLLLDLGQSIVLGMLIGTSLLGAVVTWAYRIDTRGIDLDELPSNRDVRA